MNADVEKEIRSFQGIERDNFIAAYQRSGMYRPAIIKRIKKSRNSGRVFLASAGGKLVSKLMPIPAPAHLVCGNLFRQQAINSVSVAMNGLMSVWMCKNLLRRQLLI